MRRSRYNELLARPERVNGGVTALFNGDLHLVAPDSTPREEWIVVGRFIIDHIDEPDEVTREEIAGLDWFISTVFEPPKS